jgi:hypothetical protein
VECLFQESYYDGEGLHAGLRIGTCGGATGNAGVVAGEWFAAIQIEEFVVFLNESTMGGDFEISAFSNVKIRG